MKKVLILTFVLGIFQYFNSRAQNLVPDFSMENYKQLPCSLNTSFIQDFLFDWSQPIPTSTDYWNSNADIGCHQNPERIGYFPRTGQGMVGIITASFFNGLPLEYKEYIQVKLTQPMVKGNLYSVKFYAQRRNIDEFDGLASNNLGIAFSETAINDLSPTAPNHLTIDTQLVEHNIIDGPGWHEVKGCVFAGSNFKYILIGNFISIDSTAIKGRPRPVESSNAYYFIDDVSVELLPYLIQFENPVPFCYPDSSIEIDASVTGAVGYEWYDNTTNPANIIHEKKSNVYMVNVEFNECKLEHSFEVIYFPPINLGSDTTLCVGEFIKIELNYNPTKFEFIWNDGLADSVRTFHSPGTYSVKVDTKFCNIGDEINIDFIACPGFIPNVFTPNGDEFNESFVIENIDNRIWSLKVLNRWGKEVYFTEHYCNDWTAANLNEGIYYYQLYSTDLRKEVTGWVKIAR